MQSRHDSGGQQAPARQTVAVTRKSKAAVLWLPLTALIVAGCGAYSPDSKSEAWQPYPLGKTALTLLQILCSEQEYAVTPTLEFQPDEWHRWKQPLQRLRAVSHFNDQYAIAC